MDNKEITQLKMILHDSVKLFTHKETERKKSDRSKRYLVITIMLLSNLLSVITTAYLTHLFRQCPDNNNNNNNIPEETPTYNPTIPMVNLGDLRTQANLRVGDGTEGTLDLETQLKIYGKTDPPQQERSNTTLKYGSIWDWVVYESISNSINSISIGISIGAQ